MRRALVICQTKKNAATFPLPGEWQREKSAHKGTIPSCCTLSLCCYLCNKKTTHTSRTSHTDSQCGKCKKCGIKKRLAIHTVLYARNDIPVSPSKMRLITKIMMLIFGILTIRFFLISITILLANIVVQKNAYKFAFSLIFSHLCN